MNYQVLGFCRRVMPPLRRVPVGASDTLPWSPQGRLSTSDFAQKGVTAGRQDFRPGRPAGGPEDGRTRLQLPPWRKLGGFSGWPTQAERLLRPSTGHLKSVPTARLAPSRAESGGTEVRGRATQLRCARLGGPPTGRTVGGNRRASCRSPLDAGLGLAPGGRPVSSDPGHLRPDKSDLVRTGPLPARVPGEASSVRHRRRSVLDDLAAPMALPAPCRRICQSPPIMRTHLTSYPLQDV
jgi:hypothetical protein